MKKLPLLLILIFTFCIIMDAQKKRPLDYGIKIGVLKTGKHDAITDVPGVKVGHFTLVQGDSIHTGATAIIPHSANIFQNKVPAGIFIGNGFGKMTGYPQVEELGNLETPVMLTNTLNVPAAMNALIDYTFSFPANSGVESVNAVVGETNDGALNDIRKRILTKEQIMESLIHADTGIVKEGNVGAGTGTTCMGFKGGIGTASRILPKSRGGFTVGVLVQTNFGGILQINGVPVGLELGKSRFSRIGNEYKEDGSCMIVIMTDAPLDARNLKRLAARSMYGIARTGGISSNSSGDFAIACSTADNLRIPYSSDSMFDEFKVMRNESLDILFEAVIEATEEAIINSLFAAETTTARGSFTVESIPVEKILKILRKDNRLDK
jgi:D-aminopeptidase